MMGSHFVALAAFEFTYVGWHQHRELLGLKVFPPFALV